MMRTNTGLEMTAGRLAAALMLAGGLSFSTAAAQTMPLEELRAERERAAHRERRVIFNNDGNEPVYLCEDNTPGELLRHRTADIAGTHVDSIFYCTWSSGFGMFTHGTEVGSVFDTKEALFSNNRITEMLAAGTDPLNVVADFGKQNGIEIFWSSGVLQTGRPERDAVYRPGTGVDDPNDASDPRGHRDGRSKAGAADSRRRTSPRFGRIQP